MIHRLLTYDRQRQYLYNKAHEGPVKRFLAQPFPNKKQALDKVDIIAVDFETTGLSPKKHKILSIGWVGISQGEIDLSSAQHHLINVGEQLTHDNVVIHQITDDECASNGIEAEAAVSALLNAMAGKIMLVHYSPIERRFLQAVCKKLFASHLVWPMIDTLAIAKRRLDRQGKTYAPSELRLPALRKCYGLPHYREHSALSDALSTAELFLAEAVKSQPVEDYM